MRNKLLIVGLLFSIAAHAQASLERVPIAADFAYLMANPDKVCNACQAILSGPPRSESCPLAIVRSIINAENPKESRIETVYFSRSDAPQSQKLYGRDYLSSTIPAARLKDTDNSPAFTSGALEKVSQRPSLSTSGTIVVPKGSLLDTSLLIQYANASQFVIEQFTEPDRFAENLNHLRDRKPSRELAIFDFSPRTQEAIHEMGAESSARSWQGFSKAIRDSFAAVQGQSRPMRPRTYAALKARLSDPSGAVVVIYGHSDGRSIWLDTDEGIKTLTVEDIKKIGSEAGGKLPPIILLNCQAQSTLAPAFLDAGSPFVAATDKPLGADHARDFLRRLAQAVFVEKRDVIDAYYVAQQPTAPYRMRPMAGAMRNSIESLFANMN